MNYLMKTLMLCLIGLISVAVAHNTIVDDDKNRYLILRSYIDKQVGDESIDEYWKVYNYQTNNVEWLANTKSLSFDGDLYLSGEYYRELLILNFAFQAETVDPHFQFELFNNELIINGKSYLAEVTYRDNTMNNIFMIMFHAKNNSDEIYGGIRGLSSYSRSDCTVPTSKEKYGHAFFILINDELIQGCASLHAKAVQS